MDGTPAEVFAQVDTLRAVGLDVPQATEFSLQLKNKLGIEMPDNILGVQDCTQALISALGE